MSCKDLDNETWEKSIFRPIDEPEPWMTLETILGGGLSL